MIIFLDESDDLGFDFNGKNPSKKFVIIILVCSGQQVSKEFRKAIRRTIKNKLNRKRAKRNSLQKLKGRRLTITVKEYFYR